MPTEPVPTPEPSAAPTQTKRRKRITKKRVVIAICALVILIAVAWGVTVAVGKAFTAQEQAVRSDWTTETGDLLASTEDDIELYEAAVNSDLRVAQLIPAEVDDEGFTYYDEDVQQRIADTLDGLKNLDIEWTASNPLAVLNPFGTGSNGLY